MSKKKVKKFTFGNLETGETRVLIVADNGNDTYSLFYRIANGPNGKKKLRSYENTTDSGLVSLVGSKIVSERRAAGDEVEIEEF